jgi:NAD(P)-dependent dehydrogenase (short-subunit alcohol dehydrogenase family)
MDLHLRDRAILVIGASDGIGAATARLLGREGAKVALVARRSEALDRVVHEMRGQDIHEPLPMVLDAAVEGAAERAVAQTVERFGALHGLVVVASPMGPRKPLHEASNADWQHYVDSGLMIAVQACRAALEPMRRQRDGVIVTTAAYSMRAQKSSLVAYTAAKAAVASLTKNIAKSYGPDGVRANCIAPGVVEKDAESRAELAARYGVAPERARYEFVRREFGMNVALERAGRHEEFADMIAFLLSRRASYVTGATINIDGGTDF